MKCANLSRIRTTLLHEKASSTRPGYEFLWGQTSIIVVRQAKNAKNRNNDDPKPNLNDNSSMKWPNRVIWKIL